MSENRIDLIDLIQEKRLCNDMMDALLHSAFRLLNSMEKENLMNVSPLCRIIKTYHRMRTLWKEKSINAICFVDWISELNSRRANFLGDLVNKVVLLPANPEDEDQHEVWKNVGEGNLYESDLAVGGVVGGVFLYVRSSVAQYQTANTSRSQYVSNGIVRSVHTLSCWCICASCVEAKPFYKIVEWDEVLVSRLLKESTYVAQFTSFLRINLPCDKLVDGMCLAHANVWKGTKRKRDGRSSVCLDELLPLKHFVCLDSVYGEATITKQSQTPSRITFAYNL